MVTNVVSTDYTNRARSLAATAYCSLRADILALRFEPGTALDKAKLCDPFGTSRSPVNEAVQRLALGGLVDLVPQSGS